MVPEAELSQVEEQAEWLCSLSAASHGIISHFDLTYHYLVSPGYVYWLDSGTYLVRVIFLVTSEVLCVHRLVC